MQATSFGGKVIYIFLAHCNSYTKFEVILAIF